MQPLLSRGRAAALIAAAAAVPRRVLAQPAAIRIGSYPADTYAEPYFAADGGIFTRAGLTVELTSLSTITQAIAAGALDVGLSDPVQVAHAVNAGVGLVFFAGGGLYASDAPTTLLCAGKNSPLRGAKDLEGQTIGVQQLASLGSLAAREWLRQNGADLQKVQLVEIPFSEMTAALGRGTVAAAVLAEPFLSDARGDVRPLGKVYDAVAKSFYISGWFASRDWLAKNADAAKRLTQAAYDAGRWANTHRDESGAILAKYAKLDLARVRAMTRATFATSLDTSRMQPLLDLAYRYKQLEKPVDARDLIARV
jgi:NitT/TauT family transport system substrate-binding protein